MTRRASAAFITVALVLVATLALAASGASGQSKDTVTLKAEFLTTGQASFQLLIANFERQFPNIHVDAQYLPSDQLVSLLLTQLQAGNAPDVFNITEGNLSTASVWPLASAKRLLDLSKRPWVKRLLPSVKPVVSYKGKVYSWPLILGPYAVVYNTDLFKQLHLSVPTKFSQVLSMCKQINAAGKIPFVQAWGAVTTGSIVGRQRVNQYVYSVDPNWDAKRAANKVTFDSSPLWRRALQSILDMNNSKCFQAGSTGTSRAQQYALFAQGQAVMTIVASSEIPNIKAINPKINFAWMNLPADVAKNSVLLAPFTLNIGANAATPHPQEAKTFIDFLAREKQSSLFAKVAGSLAPLDAKKGILPPEMKGLLPFFKAGKVTDAHDYQWPNPLIYTTAFQPGVVGLITGQLSIDDILKKMDALWGSG